MMMDTKKIEDRRWQIGPYDITLPKGVKDTKEEAFKEALTAMHKGSHKFASCYREAERKWVIDGKSVVLHESMPDTEEQARAIVNEANAVLD